MRVYPHSVHATLSSAGQSSKFYRCEIATDNSCLRVDATANLEVPKSDQDAFEEFAATHSITQEFKIVL